MAVFLQRHALHLHQMQSHRRGQAEIQPGRTIDKLRLHVQRRGLKRPGKLTKHLVRRLGIHIDEQAILIHSDEIKGRFSQQIAAPL